MNRRDLGGRPTYEKVRGAVRLLQDAGIQPDLLCTVNAATAADPEGTYGALEELGCVWVQFIPIVVRLPEGGFSPESVTPEGYGEFLCRVFDLWMRSGLGKLDIQLFAETARILAGGQASLCWMAPVVEEDGGVYACDHFVDPEHRLGTLGADELCDLLDCAAMEGFGRAKRENLPEDCPECPWYKFCGGGCPKDRFGGGPYYLCGGLKKLFAHSVPVLERVMELSRRGLGPEAIMRRIAKGNIIE